MMRESRRRCAIFWTRPITMAAGDVINFPLDVGEETEHSNPQPTLNALDAFRFSQYLNREPALDRAVEFLLQHWVTLQTHRPCHYGIGTLFMQVEYPFRNYNLFEYVYVLSFL